MNPGVIKRETAEYIKQLTVLLTYCWNDENFVNNSEVEQKVNEAIGLLIDAMDMLKGSNDWRYEQDSDYQEVRYEIHQD